MLIDQSVVAYQNFLRVTGWTGNTALLVEAEFFGRDQPSAQFRDRYGDDGRNIRGLTVEQHITRLGEELMPLAERFGRIMRHTVAALEGLRTVADQSVGLLRLAFADHFVEVARGRDDQHACRLLPQLATVSRPSVFGMNRSQTTRSNGHFRNASRPVSPSVAVTTVRPAASSRSPYSPGTIGCRR